MWDWTKKLDNTNHNFEKKEKAPSRKKRAIKSDGPKKKKTRGRFEGAQKSALQKKEGTFSK